MNDAPPLPPQSSSPPRNTGLVVSGIVFIIAWIGVHLVWASMAFIASAMANDSGAATDGQQMSLMFGMLAGQVLAGAAGIPAGLAFFVRGKRKLLLWTFAITFVVGVACQLIAFFTFPFGGTPHLH